MFKKTVMVSLWAMVLLWAAPAQANGTLHKRAKNLYDVGDYRAALNLYERILAQDPDDGTALDISAWCLRYLGDLKSSEEMFEKALTLLRGEDAVWVFIGLGEIYLDGKLYEKAAGRFQEALAAAPGNQEVTERASRGLDLARKALQSAGAASATTLTNGEERQKEALLPQQDAPSPPVPEARGDKTGKKPEDGEHRDLKSPDLQPQKAQPSPKPKRPASPSKKAAAPTPPRYVTVYGITLGMNIDEALAQLEASGYPIVEPPFVKKGKAYYAIERFPHALPPSLTWNAVSGRIYITGYNEAVLSVIVQLDYDNTRFFEELKGTLWQELPALTGIRDTRGIKVSDNIFSYELGLSLSNAYGIWMYVTDKANGTCRLEIEHVDLANLSHYWMAGGR